MEETHRQPDVALHEALDEGRLVEEARGRLRAGLADRDRLTSAATALGFVLAAVACAAWLPGTTSVEITLAATLTALLALASRIEFEVGPGSVVPTQVALVPMLLVLPPRLVPLLVGLAYLLAAAGEQVVRRSFHPDRLLLFLASSWHAVGPAVVIALLAPEQVTATAIPVYLLAFAAQVACDGGSALLRNCLGLGIAARSLAAPLLAVVAIDALLSPIGFLVALATDESHYAPLLAGALVALLGLLALDRRRSLDRQLLLRQAYTDANQEARNDPLTGVANRLAWEEALAQAETAVAAGAPSSVVLLDLDGLKRANDSRGHDFGDRMIQEVATLLTHAVGERGLVARLGGDEFAVLLRGQRGRSAEEVLHRIEHAFEHHPGIDGFPLSASIGLASAPPCHDLTEAIGAADAALYRQKALSKLSREHVA